MRVQLTERALADIRAIGHWIRIENPPRAFTFVRELRARCSALGSRPRAYPVLRGFEAQGIRRCNHGKYLILYRIEDDRIRVLHVLHGARDLYAIPTNR